jgi:hypothetical protein
MNQDVQTAMNLTKLQQKQRTSRGVFFTSHPGIPERSWVFVQPSSIREVSYRGLLVAW